MSIVETVETLIGESTTEPEPAIQQVPVDTDDALTLLRNSRRREVIKLVAGGGEDWTLDGLATEIARQECGHDSTFDVSGTERKRVYIALYQAHLDKLDEAGAIVRDGDDIRATPHTEAFAELLTVIDTRVEA